MATRKSTKDYFVVGFEPGTCDELYGETIFSNSKCAVEHCEETIECGDVDSTLVVYKLVPVFMVKKAKVQVEKV